MFFGCFHCWLHLFISPTLGCFHQSFFKCFHFTNYFYYCFSSTSFTMTVFLYFFVFWHFFFVLLYRECYGFERRAFLTLKRFLSHTPSEHLAQLAFIKASLGASSSSLKVAGPPTEVRNIDPVHLFVWITQCSVKGISR